MRSLRGKKKNLRLSDAMMQFALPKRSNTPQ